MEYLNLGNSGLRVSRVCLGMMSYGNDSDRPWALDEAAAEPIVKAAVEGGITFFDTADTYSGGASEIATGRLLPKFLSRDEMVVATKVFMPMTPGENGGGLSRKHILSAIDASLARLDMEYVDLYQIHRWDPRTPIEETMEALHDVVRAGKARYIGASSMFAWQFSRAQHVADLNHLTRFVSMQPHYNLIYREEEREMIPLCMDQGVGIIPWSPLARGVLAGNRDRVVRGAPPVRTPTPSPTTCTASRPTSTSSSGSPRWQASGGCPRPRSRWRGSSGGPGSPLRSWVPQGRPSRRRLGRRAVGSERRGDGEARRAVRSPSGPRTLLSEKRPGMDHPEAVDFHFDIMCPYAYQTSLWMREVRDPTGLEVGAGGSSASRRSTGPRGRSTPGSGSGPTAGP